MVRGSLMLKDIIIVKSWFDGVASSRLSAFTYSYRGLSRDSQCPGLF
jgi:hypothetical protein